MSTPVLPPRSEMYRALEARDRSYDGVFFTGVKTTGIFCRPACSARKPRPGNVEFFRTAHDALLAGYRPCRKCRPLDPRGRAPAWIERLIREVERDPGRRVTDADLRSMDLDPGRVRRWFNREHGMTFHAYQRARRLGLALGRIRRGETMTRAAFDHGYESLSGFNDAFQKLFGESPARGRSSAVVVVNRILTPLGPMVAGATDGGLCLLEFADRRMIETQIRRLRRRLECKIVPGDHPHLDLLDRELEGYFEGKVREFSVPLVVRGTEFQMAAWEYLRGIPYGETRSYEQEARAIGRTAAVRAVGRANGDNCLAILVPCHRVVRGNGDLAGYGGGLWRKKILLEMERAREGPSARVAEWVPPAVAGRRIMRAGV